MMRSVFETPLGVFGVEVEDGAVTRLHFPGFAASDFHPDPRPDGVLMRVREEVCEYFSGERKEFTLSLNPSGTEFMQRVWKSLLRIGYGEVATYGDVSKDVGSPGASRAVGMACRNNPIPLLIPCHRVIGTNGKLIGFSGGGIEIKRRLIEHEATRTGLFGDVRPGTW